MFQSLAYQVSDAAEAMEAALKRASNGNQGLQEYILQAQQNAFRIDAILKPFEWLSDQGELDPAQTALVLGLREAIDELRPRLEDAVGAEPDEQRALARELRPVARDATRTADELVDLDPARSDIILPASTVTGHEYTVQLLKGFVSLIALQSFRIESE